MISLHPFLLCLCLFAFPGLHAPLDKRDTVTWGERSGVNVYQVTLGSNPRAKEVTSAFGGMDEVHFTPDHQWALALRSLEATGRKLAPLVLFHQDQKGKYRLVKLSENPVFGKIKRPFYLQTFDWSQEHQTLVGIDRAGDLRSYSLKTGVTKQLRSHKKMGEILSITLSPDAKTVAFVVASLHYGMEPDEEDANMHTIFLLNIEKKTVTKLGYGETPDWSPDGKRILCRVNSGTSLREYRLVDKTFKVWVKPSVENIGFARYIEGGKSAFYLDTNLETWKYWLYRIDLKTGVKKALSFQDKIVFTSSGFWSD